MEKQRILFLIPSLTGGGAERTLVNLLSKLDYDLVEIDLVVVERFGVYLDQIPKEVNLISLFDNKLVVRILAYLQKKYGVDYFFRKRIQKKVKGRYDVGISFLDSNFNF